jgi:hypothetical protein
MSFKWHGDKIANQIKEAEVEALREVSEYVLETANRTVPHQDGDLERSGATSVDEQERQAAISYDTPYAARLHEHPEYNFQGKGRGKWLELTMIEEKKKVQQYLKDRISKGFK